MGKFWISLLNILRSAAGKRELRKSINIGDIFKAVMTEWKFAKSKHYKINGKHFHPKNYWSGCPSWLQFISYLLCAASDWRNKVYISRLDVWISSLRATSSAITEPFSEASRLNSYEIKQHMPFSMSRWILNNQFFNNPDFSVCEVFLLAVDLQLSEVSCLHTGWCRL